MILTTARADGMINDSFLRMWIQRLTSIVLIVVFVAVLSAAGSFALGSLLIFFPYAVATLFLCLWIKRLGNCLALGKIDTRIRFQPRTTNVVKISLSSYDSYQRQLAPIRFWGAWLLEVFLCLLASALVLIPVIAPLLER